jgi:hypothetical protein
MNCGEVSDRLYELWGQSPYETDPKLARHLTECSACRRLSDDIIAMAGAAQQLPAPPLPDNFATGLEANLMQVVDGRSFEHSSQQMPQREAPSTNTMSVAVANAGESSKSEGYRQSTRWNLPLALAASIAAVTIGIWFFAGPRNPSSTGAADEVRVSSVTPAPASPPSVGKSQENAYYRLKLSIYLPSTARDAKKAGLDATVELKLPEAIRVGGMASTAGANRRWAFRTHLGPGQNSLEIPLVEVATRGGAANGALSVVITAGGQRLMRNIAMRNLQKKHGQLLQPLPTDANLKRGAKYRAERQAGRIAFEIILLPRASRARRPS